MAKACTYASSVRETLMASVNSVNRECCRKVRPTLNIGLWGTFNGVQIKDILL